jgi:hypothetical protein
VGSKIQTVALIISADMPTASPSPKAALSVSPIQAAPPPDARINHPLDWIGRELVLPGLRAGRTAWAERRLLIFTEYEDTRRWVERLLREAIAHTERADGRARRLAFP